MLSSASFTSYDIDMLCSMFPQLDTYDAKAILSRKGSIEAAADVLVADVEVFHSESDEEEEDLPAYMRCPKCYSPDIEKEEKTQTIVCWKCHHHFEEENAKRGASRSMFHKKIVRNGKKQNNKPELADQLTEPEPPSEKSSGPQWQKLEEARSQREQNPTLRVVVSHSGSPKDKRVISVPISSGLDSLFKQARAKFHLKKQVRGARLLPEATVIDSLDDIPNGSEVLVTYSSLVKPVK